MNQKHDSIEETINLDVNRYFFNFKILFILKNRSLHMHSDKINPN